MSSKTFFNDFELLPPDALFSIKQRYAADDRTVKVDLGIGAYRDENGKPWVLNSVKEAEKLLLSDPNYNHEYLGISGLNDLVVGAGKVILGEDSAALKEDRVISVQSLSGTGALHIAAKLLALAHKNQVVYLSDPTWVNHNNIFESQGLQTHKYPYWQNETKSLNIPGFLECIEKAPPASVFVLHACAHNPTGLDPSQEQWVQIVSKIGEKGHIALFDSAYQGFASGDLTKDALAVRLGVEKLADVSPILICQSFAKNVGMYGERVGCFHIVLPKQDKETNVKIKKSVSSQLANVIRGEVSNPPSYGAKIVAKILSTDHLTAQWHKDMITMSSRIAEMRKQLRDKLQQLQTPGTWDHLVEQCGMFSYTGLSKEMVQRLEKEHAVYMAASGRASMAGVNPHNVNHVAKAIDEVVRHFQ